LQSTIGTVEAAEVKATWGSQAAEWIRGLRFPIGIPQLAPVAMMLIFAFFVFSQTVSADGTLTGVYSKSVELAEQTYEQSANALNGKPVSQGPKDPVSGATYVNNEDNK
jgi:hypothetical protein